MSHLVEQVGCQVFSEIPVFVGKLLCLQLHEHPESGEDLDGGLERHFFLLDHEEQKACVDHLRIKSSGLAKLQVAVQKQ